MAPDGAVWVLESEVHAQEGGPGAGRPSELDRVPALLGRFAPLLFSESTTYSQAALVMRNALDIEASAEERRGEQTPTIKSHRPRLVQRGRQHDDSDSRFRRHPFEGRS